MIQIMEEERAPDLAQQADPRGQLQIFGKKPPQTYQVVRALIR